MVAINKKGGEFLYTKQCTRCKHKSYSSSNMKEWQCPYCAQDLTDHKAKPVNHHLNIDDIYKKVFQKQGLKIYKQIHLLLP